VSPEERRAWTGVLVLVVIVVGGTGLCLAYPPLRELLPDWLMSRGS
jgi:hypothetical protein